MRIPLRSQKTNQDGNILIMASIVLSTAIILLASIDIGFLFYQKRELQKIADMAAIAGTQQLVRSIVNEETSCESAFSVATENARVNGGTTISPDITCGHWDPQQAVETPDYAAIEDGEFGATLPNAVEVIVERSYGSFFGAWASQRVNARAIAMGTPTMPTAVFSVGSRLLRIDSNGAVPTLLNALGLDISSTQALSYNGIANASVRTGNLLRALGFDIPLDADIGTLTELVKTSSTDHCQFNRCSLDTLIDAISAVGGQQELVSVLGLPAETLDLQVKLLSDQNGRGLLDLENAANGQSAVNTSLSIGELVGTALQVANNQRGVDLPGLNIDLSPAANVTTKLGLVEPQSVGFGGIGTVAYTSQLRLFSKVEIDTGGLVKASLPTAIDLVNGRGELTELCEEKDAEGNHTATIHVSAPILRTCVGNIDEATVFSRNTSCETGLSNHPLLSILGGTVKVESSFKLDALPYEQTVVLAKGQTTTVGHNNLQIGTTVRNLYKAVLAETLGKLLGQGQGPVSANSLAGNLLAAGSNNLTATINNLNNTLSSLKSFINSLGSNAFLQNPLATLLSGVGNLVTGLLTSVTNLLGNLVGNLACAFSGNYNQCMVEKELTGSQGNVSNVLLTLLGLVTQQLQPVLDPLGNLLAQRLQNLLGVNLGEVDVTLIDLQCEGESNVRLVH